MSTSPKQDSPERGQTDESLRTERERTDRALAVKHDAAEEDADTVLQRARDHADAVLLAARDKADDQLDQTGFPGTVVVEQRLVEDRALDDERASADETLRRERAASARALTGLLPLEREKTDRFLLTERARSDGALSNRDDFLGMVSHDLRDLLGGVVMSAAILARSAAPDAKGTQALEHTSRIQRYAARMNRLIGDLLDVTSIDAGKLAVTPAPASLAGLIAEAAETFEAAASAKNIALKIEMLDEDTLLADFDRDRMLQVLANLITNAIKFTPHGGTITLRRTRVEDELRFSMTDSGVGIPTDMLEAVFERFWQAGVDERKGLGLGLYISRHIVEAHGGRIWAESSAAGGATIVFTLPAVPAISGEGSPAPSAGPQSARS